MMNFQFWVNYPLKGGPRMYESGSPWSPHCQGPPASGTDLGPSFHDNRPPCHTSITETIAQTVSKHMDWYKVAYFRPLTHKHLQIIICNF